MIQETLRSSHKLSSASRNCFDDIITDNYQMAKLLNYKFSKIGDYNGSD